MLDTASIQVDEAASSLRNYAGRVDLDPQRLADVEAPHRRDLRRRAQASARAGSDSATNSRSCEARLAALRAAQDVDALRARADAARSDYDQAAGELSRQRRRAATRLAKGVSAHLATLGMAGGRLEIACETAEPAASGIDAIEFRVAAHAGATPRALAKVASGGELSRIGLAIAVMAAQANPVPTLIFDEADAGVGGAVADAVGALMRRLGEDRQVLCVTHLPQVAAKAHQQWRVSKHSAAGRTVAASSSWTG